jgi:hypothetical protein
MRWNELVPTALASENVSNQHENDSAVCYLIIIVIEWESAGSLAARKQNTFIYKDTILQCVMWK